MKTNNLGCGIDAVAANLIKEHPISMALVEAGMYLGFPTSGSCYVARSRHEFPVRVTRTGAGLRVMTHDLLDYVKSGVSQATPRQGAVAAARAGAGRPRKSEQVKALAMGLSVPELRAQSSIVGGM